MVEDAIKKLKSGSYKWAWAGSKGDDFLTVVHKGQLKFKSIFGTMPKHLYHNPTHGIVSGYELKSTQDTKIPPFQAWFSLEKK